MIRASINGVLLIPGIDYVVDREYMSFTQAPRYGDRIHVMTPNANADFYGNDVTFRFPMPTVIQKSEVLEGLMHDLDEYMDHPTVKDQLERLQVVLELVKNPPKTD